MRILIVSPGTRLTLTGNWNTAERWRAILEDLGHTTGVGNAFDPVRDAWDLLVALHARRSHGAIARFHSARAGRPIVVVLTGTDLYQDLPGNADARASLELATRIIALQRGAFDVLPAHFHDKVRIIYQSATCAAVRALPDPRCFAVCVVANVRPEKDPLLVARAARLLPSDSRVRVTLIGAALSPEDSMAVRTEESTNPRLRWAGHRSHETTLAAIAASDVVVIPSRTEGSSNVLSEALVAGVPVLLTRIPGLIGTVGADYPGLFEPGDVAGLASLLERAERDATFLSEIAAAGARLRPLVEPAAERAAWSELLAELGAT